VAADLKNLDPLLDLLTAAIVGELQAEAEASSARVGAEMAVPESTGESGFRGGHTSAPHLVSSR
jgi:hypothetical protein